MFPGNDSESVEGPQITHQQASEPGAGVAAGEAAPFEGRAVVGEASDREAGQQAKNPVQNRDQGGCDEAAKAAGRDSELRNHPDCVGRQGGSEFQSEALDFGSGEAIEEEMSDDEVVSLRLGWLPMSGVGGEGA